MFEITISEEKVERFKLWLQGLPWFSIVLDLSIILSFVAIEYSLLHSLIIAYGDSESHLNIPKRVVDSITPGMAQLGGIWLPLPHLLMLPFIKLDVLYRTGLAGSFVSGASFVISCVYIYKLTFFLTKNYLASLIAFFVFATNPNILYLQTTPLTEPLLICFFILSSYYFIRFISIALRDRQVIEIDDRAKNKEFIYLIFAALFGFCASFSRYDGWFLVLIEAIIIIVVYLPINKYWHILKTEKIKGIATLLKERFYLLHNRRIKKLQGMIILFSVLAFLGIVLWFVWGWLILGDPFYFTNSAYSAKTQQLSWMQKGQLPAYHNLFIAVQYYFFDSMTNIGIVVFVIFLIGFFNFLIKDKSLFKTLIILVLLAPFMFNVITLYIGQSIIFIPHITPANFEWRTFNVRYGILMLPAAALFFGILFYHAKKSIKLLLIFLLVIQFGLYFSGYSKVISVTDGVEGLSTAKKPDAENWMSKHYDNGLVLLDDFSRSMSIIRANIPMKDVIYIGNKPYWGESMKQPEKYAKWIVIQKEDDVWKNIYEKPDVQGRLYKYFSKVYTSPDILIFERNNVKAL